MTRAAWVMTVKLVAMSFEDYNYKILKIQAEK